MSFAVNTLLPVLDTLEIAADAPTADESYKKGVTMTLDKCREAFGKMGVSEIEAAGQALRPRAARSRAAAALYRRHAQRHRHSKVCRKVTCLHDKVIRHAARGCGRIG